MTNDHKQLVRDSKFLSLVLRHAPYTIGVELDKHGWADVDTLLRAIRDHKRAPDIDRERLNLIVATNNKGRFEFHGDGTKIRARQGHSVKVDLGYKAQKPPAYLFHGTGAKTLPVILREGLRPMKRHHVHLSVDEATARAVGQRHGKPVVLRVLAQEMDAGGHKFYVTGNGVWLVEHVPREFLETPTEDEL